MTSMSGASAGQASRRETPETLIPQILALMAKLASQFASEEHENWRWLIEHSHTPLVVDALRELTPTALRVVGAIGQWEPVNGVTISTRSRIPKGTVSKVTRRLIAQNLASSESLPNNKKEVLFRLTPLGQDLFRVHRAFDEQMERGFRQFLRRYDAAELALLVRVLQEATDASFLTLGLQAPPQPEHDEHDEHGA